MEIRLPLIADSDNKEIHDELVITEAKDNRGIIFNISDERREVTVCKSDLVKVLKILI